ncbi:MAG TPA: tRNA (N(6)-L-threonylcarbamoyladenosine(37)-C(2))-methylthiotransferase MtaB [Ignavibacteriaceae bacterium]|nr:tRNA (N(6)-L-threonylcarbamoyladenosine(37)-C(2))-methylthiotransferase MtaB [Ignavibacteriaceae bacterium]
MSKKIALHTLGCKLNYSETSTIGKNFIDQGFELVDFKSKADVYLINTCTVTENADRECRQIIRSALRKNPEAAIVVTGCYAQLKPEEIASIEGVDYILGSKEKFEIFSLLENLDKKDKPEVFVTSTEEHDKSFGIAASSDSDERTRAFFKIQDGCDYKCSYCTIPLARGKSRSLQPEQVLKQFNDILQLGYKEIILTGVNVGDYGKNTGINLLGLLKKMIEIEGDFRIRISSIEPNLLNDSIIELTAESGKLCNHFHIPLQSGNNKILSLMQRRYKRELYHDLIYKIKNRIPDAGIGVDVIVGFPGESYDDFIETYNFLKELPISYLHVFTYSERENTLSVTIKDKVAHTEKKKRTNMLRILSEKKRFEFHQSLLNNCVEVIFEENNINGKMKGYSSNYVRVTHDFNIEFVNSSVLMKITEAKGDICKGEIMGIKKSVV